MESPTPTTKARPDAVLNRDAGSLQQEYAEITYHFVRHIHLFKMWLATAEARLFVDSEKGILPEGSLSTVKLAGDAFEACQEFDKAFRKLCKAKYPSAIWLKNFHWPRGLEVESEYQQYLKVDRKYREIQREIAYLRQPKAEKPTGEENNG